MKGFLITILILALLTAGFYYWKSDEESVINDDEMVACTMDAKLCPDGSYVGRIPPSCEFAACPSTASSTIDVNINAS